MIFFAHLASGVSFCDTSTHSFFSIGTAVSSISIFASWFLVLMVSVFMVFALSCLCLCVLFPRLDSLNGDNGMGKLLNELSVLIPEFSTPW